MIFMLKEILEASFRLRLKELPTGISLRLILLDLTGMDGEVSWILARICGSRRGRFERVLESGGRTLVDVGRFIGGSISFNSVRATLNLVPIHLDILEKGFGLRGKDEETKVEGWVMVMAGDGDGDGDGADGGEKHRTLSAVMNFL
uniref:Uncharacterized protein n=1 Tax=Vespula pensylvanica TaxID=30213 RepID=A0A834U3X4_VESPE|nr:hypothetical protein H0235_011985 [Vespula pensylvanica]